jgi:hypothetical protein
VAAFALLQLNETLKTQATSQSWMMAIVFASKGKSHLQPLALLRSWLCI